MVVREFISRSETSYESTTIGLDLSTVASLWASPARQKSQIPLPAIVFFFFPRP